MIGCANPAPVLDANRKTVLAMGPTGFPTTTGNSTRRVVILEINATYPITSY